MKRQFSLLQIPRAAMFTLALSVFMMVPSFAQVKHVQQLEFSPLPDFEIPVPKRVVLENGLVVLMLEDHELPFVNISAKIRTGSRLEPATQVGLAQLVGRVMRSGGTTTLSGDALDDYLEGKAANIETAIGEVAGGASMSCLKEDFPDVFQVFADVLRHPSFDAEKLAIAKSQAMAGISRQNDNPDSIVGREFKKLLYGQQSPYARTPTYASMSAITRKDLLDWHETFFQPNRIILGITGDFQPHSVMKLVKQVFADWKPGLSAADPSVPYQDANSAKVFYVEKNDMTQAKIMMGHLGVLRKNPDYYALVLANQILSGSFGARLFSNIRSKQGLAYDVQGGVGFQWDYPGMAVLSMSTKTETTGAGIESLIREARDMVKNPPTDEEVEKAKSARLNSFVFSVDSPSKVLGKYLTYEYFGYSSDWLSKFKKGIEQVTTEQVREAARKHLRPEDFSILVVGPRKGTASALARYESVQELDITIPEPS